MSELSAAVLAGGESRRMGRDKALVDLGGRSLVARVVERLGAISDDVFVVAKRAGTCGDVRVVLDDAKEQTPLAGVLGALRAARHPIVFVCGVDMPLIDPDLVRRLAELATGVDCVVPRHDGVLQVLHAVWSTDCDLDTVWKSGERSVRGALDRLSTRVVEVASPRSFTNVNTPDDLAAISSTRPRPPSSRRSGS